MLTGQEASSQDALEHHSASLDSSGFAAPEKENNSATRGLLDLP
jgi:hypothetical protein